MLTNDYQKDLKGSELFPGFQYFTRYQAHRSINKSRISFPDYGNNRIYIERFVCLSVLIINE